MKQGYTDIVYAVIKESHKLGLPYITKRQLHDNLIQKYPHIYWANRVGQCLYHLQKKNKYHPPYIRKYYTNGKKMGYTINDDSTINL